MEMKRAEQEILTDKVRVLFFKLFEAAQYQKAFVFLHKYSQTQPLPQDIIDFIMAAFVEPNLVEIKGNVAANGHLLERPVGAEGLNYYILPSEAGFNFILDLALRRLIEIKNEFTDEINAIVQSADKFSDYSVLLKGKENIINFFSLAQELKKINRNLYVVIGSEWEALLQMKKYSQEEVDNIRLFPDLFDFEKHFLNTEDYFPRNIIKYDDSPVNQLAEVRERIHAYRLAHKCGKRPLLSIGIPSAERGMFALSNILHTLKAPFDYEIEVVLSDNASTTLPEYYELIKTMPDSRLVYHRNDSNLGYHGNVKKLIELARAKYLLFNCDTDVLKLDRLDEILMIIRDAGQEYSQIKTDFENQWGGNYVESAYDTIKLFSFQSNYLFGNIFNIDLVKNGGFLNYLDEQAQNSEFILNYYHMAIDLFLEGFGRTYVIKDMVVDEYQGETPYLVGRKFIYAEQDEFEDFENFTQKYNSEYMTTGLSKRQRINGYKIGRNKVQNLHRAYTIAGRTAQHISCAKLLRDIFYNDERIEEFSIAYVKLYRKTLVMIALNTDCNYAETDLENTEIIQKIRQAMAYIEKENEQFYQMLEGLGGIDLKSLKESMREIYDHFERKVNLVLTERFA